MLKDKFVRTKLFVKNNTLPLVATTGAAVGSVATLVILKKSNMLDQKDITWFSYASREAVAKAILEAGHVIVDCDHCDRTLTLIVDPLNQ